jgi:uncharacterized protein YecE (DUF72 family)
MAIRIGIGSWADDDYTGVLYPEGLPAKERLKTYATHFEHVEVNSTFYATPRQPVVAGWAKQTPPGFTFNIKLHRAFSQNPRKAADEGKLLEWTLAGVTPLVKEKKLGAFLLVLEPEFGPEKRRLDELDSLVQNLQPHALAVELRHSGWVDEARRAETIGYFRARQIAWVAVDMPKIKGSTIMPAIDEVTSADLAYLRLHGRNKGWLQAKSAAERHAYPYTEKELKELAARVKTLAAKAKDVHVIANNHAQDFAPKTALALKAMLKD